MYKTMFFFLQRRGPAFSKIFTLYRRVDPSQYVQRVLQVLRLAQTTEPSVRHCWYTVGVQRPRVVYIVARVHRTWHGTTRADREQLVFHTRRGEGGETDYSSM